MVGLRNKSQSQHKGTRVNPNRKEVKGMWITPNVTDEKPTHYRLETRVQFLLSNFFDFM